MPALTVQVGLGSGRDEWRTVPAVGVKHTQAAPGGCTSGEFTITDAGNLPDLDNTVPVRFSSKRSGRCVWSGTVASPAVRRDETGAMTVPCDGEAIALARQYFRLPYLVTRQDCWQLDPVETGSKNTSLISSLPNNDNTMAVGVQIESGPVKFKDRGRARCTAFLDADLSFGAFYGWNVSSLSATQWDSILWVGPRAEQNYVVRDNCSTTPRVRQFVASGLAQGHGYAPVNRDVISMEIYYYGANQADMTSGQWTGWYNMRIYGGMRDRNGARQGIDTTKGLPAWRVIEDLLGRVPYVVATDSARTRVDQSSPYRFDTLDYSQSPVTVADVLGDLVAFEPDFNWRVSPRSPIDNLAGFTWEPWPTAARYQLPLGVTAWDNTGSDQALCDRARVDYTDPDGTPRTVWKATQEWIAQNIEATLTGGHPPVIEAEPIELTQETSSPGNAARILDAYLASVSAPPRSGKATIDRPIVDLSSGGVVAPEHLTAGVTARVPETGETLRVTRVEYDDDTGAATLSLDDPRRTPDQIIADVTRRRYK